MNEKSTPSKPSWSPGSWAVFDLNVVMVKEVRDSTSMEVSDGSFSTSGNLASRLRPLTLRNKATAEYFQYWYRELKKLDGEAGFNYPDISRHFSDLSTRAMDGDLNNPEFHDAAIAFVSSARRYEPVIQGVPLFRKNRRAS